MHGRLDLAFEKTSHGGTVLRIRRQEPPWRVLRAFPNGAGQALVHLHNTSGGVLGGDRLELQVDLSPGARVQLTTTGATRVYRPRTDAGEAQSTAHFNLAENSLPRALAGRLDPIPRLPLHPIGHHESGAGSRALLVGTVGAGTRSLRRSLRLRAIASRNRNSRRRRSHCPRAYAPRSAVAPSGIPGAPGIVPIFGCFIRVPRGGTRRHLAAPGRATRLANRAACPPVHGIAG